MKTSKKSESPRETPLETLARRALSLVQSARRRQASKGRFVKDPPISDLNAELADLERTAQVALGEGSPVRPGYTRTFSEESVLRDGEYREHHESFGVIRMGRLQSMGRSGHHRLFGSSLDMHPTVIEFKIMRAERVRGKLDNSRYWPLHNRYDEICTIRMSVHQFAELISGMGGLGVPCTLKSVQGIGMEDVPAAMRHEHEEIVDDIEELIRNRPRAGKALEQAREIIDKPHIGKKDRVALLGLIETIADGGMKDVGFYMERFNEAAEKVRANVRADIEGTLDTVMRRLGERALQTADHDEIREQLTKG